MNKYKVWQIILIYSVLTFGVIFALPNFYPTKPAIQIAFGDSARALNTNIIADITRELDAKNIPFTELINFNDIDKLDSNFLKNKISIAANKILNNKKFFSNNFYNFGNSVNAICNQIEQIK